MGAIESFSLVAPKRQWTISLRRRLGVKFCSLAIALCPVAFAQSVPNLQTGDIQAKLQALEAATKSAQSAGDNAWMLVSAALVLMMTGPGLALFYGGLVRRK